VLRLLSANLGTSTYYSEVSYLNLRASLSSSEISNKAIHTSCWSTARLCYSNTSSPANLKAFKSYEVIFAVLHVHQGSVMSLFHAAFILTTISKLMEWPPCGSFLVAETEKKVSTEKLHMEWNHQPTGNNCVCTMFFAITGHMTLLNIRKPNMEISPSAQNVEKLQYSVT
jgi:hypothetical protein